MWIHKVKYEDYDGNPQEKTLYFNLREDEMISMQMSVKGGIENYYKRLLDENDNVELYKRFEELIKLTYGKKSDDGQRFSKSEEIYNDFKESMAYDAFIDYLFTDPNGAANFITGILPKKIQAKLNSPEGQKLAAEHGFDISPLTNK